MFCNLASHATGPCHGPQCELPWSLVYEDGIFSKVVKVNTVLSGFLEGLKLRALTLYWRCNILNHVTVTVILSCLALWCHTSRQQCSVATQSTDYSWSRSHCWLSCDAPSAWVNLRLLCTTTAAIAPLLACSPKMWGHNNVLAMPSSIARGSKRLALSESSPLPAVPEPLGSRMLKNRSQCSYHSRSVTEQHAAWLPT